MEQYPSPSSAVTGLTAVTAVTGGITSVFVLFVFVFVFVFVLLFLDDERVTTGIYT
jgi:acid phosphatase family membrane protein YuiD